MSIAELGAKAEALEATGDKSGAAQLYLDWIKHSKSPLVWVAQFNLGVLLRNLGDLEGAVESYRASLAINPKVPHARINLGTVLEALNRFDEAIAEWKTTLSYLDEDPKVDPNLLCTVLNNLGRRLEVMQKYSEAEGMLTRSLLLKPKQDAVLYHRIFLRQKQCAWPIYAPLPGITLEDQQAATSAVAMLSISDDPELQLKTALSQVPGKIPKDLPKLAAPNGYIHDRLRIGYLSSNFGMHAVSILTAELYELHDRSRVEVWGFCWSPEDNTEMRERVIRAMDHFIRIKDMSDEQAAKAIREAEIDVLIDLQGLTAGCRPKILAYRPAPVQITYLGFPGTTGLPEIDYVLADRYIIPEESAKYFTEKPLYLPDCFQVNDRKRQSTAPKSRAEYGIPEDAFVFCAFNNNIKFTPEFFATWMRILQRTPHSVLWLLADNEKAKTNLGNFAEQHGVNHDRLIFAQRVPVADYLARFAVADLFLDLFPFNGGTTAADALWMDLPIVTCSGRSFASRMAGSLLTSVGVPELITHTVADYENLAVELASQPGRMQRLREKLSCSRQSPLFDTPKLVRQLEDALIQVSAYKDSVSIPETSPFSTTTPTIQVVKSAASLIATTQDHSNDPGSYGATPNINLRTQAPLRAFCIGHVPPVFSPGIDYTMLCPKALGIPGEIVIEDNRFGPAVDGTSLAEYSQLFVLADLLSTGDIVADNLFLFQYRKFISPRIGGAQSVSPWIRVLRPEEAGTFFPTLEQLQPHSGKTIVGSLFELGGSTAANYVLVHVVDDFALFIAACARSRFLSESDIKGFTTFRGLIPSPAVAHISAPLFVRIMTILNDVWVRMFPILHIPREGYQRRSAGYLMERLHSYLLCKWLLDDNTQPINLWQRYVVAPDQTGNAK